MVILSCKPYFVYSHPGYARLSLNDYNLEDYGVKSSDARCTHLTNLGIQKKHPGFKERKHETTMSDQALCEELIKEGKVKDQVEYKEKVTARINEVMRLMFLQIKDKLDRKFGCFEIFGFDFMLDGDLMPKLLEININPALFLDTNTLEQILPPLVTDLCDMAVDVHQPGSLEASPETIQTAFAKSKLSYEIIYQE